MTLIRRLFVAVMLVLGAVLIRPAAVHTQESQDQLEQLVAPVALDPDELLADVLAAATFPSEVDAAAQWLRQNASLSSDQIAESVDGFSWDDSVKALTEFPAVLENLDQNLSWTSALGDAYYNEPDAVMDAIQTLRQRALAAGTLQSNSQITVSNNGGLIAIEPASADDVYVPSYDAWDVYGAALPPWPDFVFASGVVRGPRISWGLHVRIGGAWSRERWGSRNWNFDWRQRRVVFNRQPFVSHSPSVIDRRAEPRASRAPAMPPAPPRPGQPPDRNRPGAQSDVRPGQPPILPQPGRGREDNRFGTRPATGQAAPKPFAPPVMESNPRAARGFPEQRPAVPPAGTHAGAMNQIDRGGAASHDTQRGQASMGARQAPSPRAEPPARSAGPGPGRSAGPPPARTAPPNQGRGRGGRQ